jgi:hypothetical protein
VLVQELEIIALSAYIDETKKCTLIKEEKRVRMERNYNERN